MKGRRVRMKTEDIVSTEEAVKSLDGEPITVEAFQVAMVRAS